MIWSSLRGRYIIGFIYGLALFFILGCDDAPTSSMSNAGEQAGNPQAGIMIAGIDIPLAGEPMAGEPMAGEPMAGELMAGEPMAGEPMAGEPMAGEPMAGEPMAGEPMAGEPMAGEPMAGEPMAGEPMAGEPMAGEPMAGELMAGEPMAGEPMAGMMIEDPSAQVGDHLEFESAVQMDASTTHLFSVDQDIGVKLRVMGQNGELCPENVDSVLSLYRSEGEGRSLVIENDDYMAPDHFCSEIITTISAGDYQAVVSGYGGQEIANYVLSIDFYPALMSGDLCDLDSLSAGVCPFGHLCLANQCMLTRPQIDVATASKSDEAIYLHVEGADADLDAAYLNLALLDEFGNELIINDAGDTVFYTYIPETAAPLTTGLASFVFDYITVLPNLEFASELRVEIEDLAGNVSEALIIPLSLHPILNEGDECLVSGMNGLCAQGLTCRPNQQEQSASCQASAAPIIDSATLHARTGDLVLKAVGQDADQDIIGLGITLYDTQGQAIFGMGGANREFIESIYQEDVDALQQAYFVTLGGAFVPNTVAAEIALVDQTGLESQVLIAQLLDLPEQALNSACDVQILQNICAEGVCYPNPSTIDQETSQIGTCRTALPQRGEFCDYNFGCAEGFVCYGPNNNGNLSDRFQTCMRSCDANADVDGCEQDELCLPDIDWASLGNTEVPSPGVCLISDQCLAGEEASTCPQANSNCLRVQNITLCVDLSTVADEQVSAVGEACTGINQVCDQGLLCELGVCRQPCHIDGMCGAEENCRVFDEIYYDDPNRQYAACLEICDPVSQDCEAGQSCTLFQSDSSQGRLSICLDEPAGTLGDGEACTRNIDDNYWGNCSADQFCTRLYRDDVNECLPICTVDDNSACTGQRACALDLLGTPDVGLCTGQCEFFNGQGCEAQQSCLIGIQGQNADQETIISGVCINNPNRGEQATGEPCVYDQANNTSNCQAAHLCIDIDNNSTDECAALCQAGNPEHDCPLNSTCVNILSDGSYLFGEELSTLGLCFPNQ